MVKKTRRKRSVGVAPPNGAGVASLRGDNNNIIMYTFRNGKENPSKTIGGEARQNCQTPQKQYAQ